MHACYHEGMAQLTLRVDDELARRLKDVAAERHQSVNAYAGAVLAAVVDPSLAGDDVERLRERLARAGLLVPASDRERRRPSEAVLGRARSAAGRGEQLSDLVAEGRR